MAMANAELVNGAVPISTYFVHLSTSLYWRSNNCWIKARRTYSRLHLFTTRLNCREPIGSRPCSVHCPDYITTRSTPSDSLNAADVYAPWCHLVFRHASVMTAVVIGGYLKSGDSRFSWGICWNVSRPGRNTVASDAWPSFKARRRWIGAKSLVCTPGFRHEACHLQLQSRVQNIISGLHMKQCAIHPFLQKQVTRSITVCG